MVNAINTTIDRVQIKNRFTSHRNRKTKNTSSIPANQSSLNIDGQSLLASFSKIEGCNTSKFIL